MSSFKSLLIISFLFFFNQVLFSQIEFQSGYFITNSGERVDCLIKNLDWKNNPSSFKYKVKGDDNIVTGKKEQVKEFSITRESKYIRETVMVDLSSTLINRIPKTIIEF